MASEPAGERQPAARINAHKGSAETGRDRHRARTIRHWARAPANLGAEHLWSAARGLRFSDPAQENAFFEGFVLSRRHEAQLAMLLGSVVYFTFLLWDGLIDPSHAGATFAIRGVVTAFLGASILVLWLPFFQRWMEMVLLLFTCVPSIGLAAICALLDNGFAFGAAGLIVILLFVYALLAMRIGYFVVFSAVSWGVFAAVEFVDSGSKLLWVNHMCIGSAVLLGLFAAATREVLARRHHLTAQALERSRSRVDELLHSILPREIVSRLQAGETSIADAHDDVCIVFADLAEFTALSQGIAPKQLVRTLDRLFSALDEQAERYGMEKIKTIGDAYMAVAGLSDRNVAEPAEQAARFALAIQAVVVALSAELGLTLRLRVGLHVGPVVAGVLGVRRPAFDCWGAAVNLASRLESQAIPGTIALSEAAHRRLQHAFVTHERGRIELKGVGMQSVFTLGPARV
jgi:class 3 adenylate cyclase